ncbi:MAG: magnesium-dependent phosphatase-1 [Planctomycetota bacterium]|nr:magnesium-dependent phosphatase-1 [Planctomycetota bacterium]
MVLPKLIVFDLDFTLWDCGGTWCDCLAPPFTVRNHRIWDRGDRQIRLYNDVSSILDQCDTNGTPMALASRTEQPPWARELLDLLGLSQRFVHAEIYPSSKLMHFAEIQKASGIEFAEMLFFDDEMRNIREVSNLGVTSILVKEGITRQLFDDALRKHAAHRQRCG